MFVCISISKLADIHQQKYIHKFLHKESYEKRKDKKRMFKIKL